MDWEEFVKDFVSEVDYDIAKQLEPETAESPDEADGRLKKLVESAKQFAARHLGIKYEDL